MVTGTRRAVLSILVPVLVVLLIAAGATPSSSRTAMEGLAGECASLPWCTPSFWAWELQLAVHRGDLQLAGAIAQHLRTTQEPGGSWGLGTDWGRVPGDFKVRTARDAESWEVAEVGLALLAYSDAAGSRPDRAAARGAAQYLRARVDHVDGRPYLAHMPDCNNRLQPHSTIAAAALLARFPKYLALARSLRRAGKDMRWRRIVPAPGETSLAHPTRGPAINDYEKIQVGYYLTLVGDPAGRKILRTYPPGAATDFYRAPPYLVMVDLLTGHRPRAERRATGTDFAPQRGYDLALADWLRSASRVR